MSTPMVVELHDPHCVSVVDVRHVSVIEIDNIGIGVERDIAWTH